MAGAQLLAQTARVSGLDEAMSVALAPWCKPRAVHDPGKVLVDVAIALAAGGDCPADVAVLRAGSQLFGPVASDPTISRLVDTLAADLGAAVAAIRGAHAQCRFGRRDGSQDAVPPGRRVFPKAELQRLFDHLDDQIDREHAAGGKRWLPLLRDSIAFKVAYAYGCVAAS